MVSIYALETDGLIWYVGSTMNVVNRKMAHKYRINKGYASDLIPQEYEFQFKILEECEAENRYIRERYYYELLKPLVNKDMPGRSDKESQKEYYQNHKEQKKEYYQNHKEYIKEYHQSHKDRYNELRRIRRAKAKALTLNPSPSSSQEQ